MRTRLATLAALVALTLAACGGADTGSAPTASVTAASQTDIAFAQSMIPHHEQAVEIADLALDPQSESSPEVKKLATQIKAAQDPEITQMTGWLQQWGAPTAMPGASSAASMPGMDHSGHDMGSMTVSGMMTAQDMSALSQARGTDFDRMWLTMMIAHHEGAITMAEQVQDSGNAQVGAMADAIISGQQDEITTMQGLLSAQ